jgi:hypothetical protein
MSWSEEDIERVWQKGKVALGYDPDRWRKDDCAWMTRVEYGNRQSPEGWEIDHISPSGGDHIGNLRPLQWENNVDKGDGQWLACPVTSSGTKNVRR